MADTKADAKDTSEGDGKNTKGKAEGADTDAAKKDQDDKQFTQADLDRIAAKTRKEEREKAKADKDREDRERLEAKAKEQGEFEKLAGEREQKIKELEPQIAALTKENESLRSTVIEIAKAELKALPEDVRDTSPAQYDEDKILTNPVDVLAWLPKGKKLAERLSGETAKPGAKQDPKPKGAPGEAEKDKEAQALMANNYTRW
jgi:hypothetical protein